MDSNMTYREFADSKYADAIYSTDFPLTYIENDKTVERTFFEVCDLWWGNMLKENQEIIKSMPNFDANIFAEITGIQL
jgi:hypothetical protein